MVDSMSRLQLQKVLIQLIMKVMIKSTFIEVVKAKSQSNKEC